MDSGGHRRQALVRQFASDLIFTFLKINILANIQSFIVHVVWISEDRQSWPTGKLERITLLGWVTESPKGAELDWGWCILPSQKSCVVACGSWISLWRKDMAGGSTCSGPLTSMSSSLYIHCAPPRSHNRWPVQTNRTAWNLVSLLSVMPLTTYFLLSGELLPP